MSGWRPEFPEWIEKQRAAEKQREEQRARQKQEVQQLQQQANTEAWNTWFYQRFLEVFKQLGLTETLGEVIGKERIRARKEFKPQIDALEARIKTLEQQASFEQKFADLEQRLDARQIARDEAKRGSEMIPQSEFLARIEKVQRQVDDLKSVADRDGRFRELAERVGELEKTNSLEARFAKLLQVSMGDH